MKYYVILEDSFSSDVIWIGKDIRNAWQLKKLQLAPKKQRTIA